MSLFNKKNELENGAHNSGMPEYGKENVKGKVANYVGIGIGLILALYIIPSLMKPSDTLEVKDSEWKVQELFGIAGLTLESPCALKVGNDPSLEQLKQYTDKYSFYMYESTPFGVSVMYLEYINNTPANIDGAANGTALGQKNGMSSNAELKDFTYEITPNDKFGLNGRLVKADYLLNGKKGQLYVVLFAKGNKLWQVQCGYLNNETNRKIA